MDKINQNIEGQTIDSKVKSTLFTIFLIAYTASPGEVNQIR